MGSDEETGSDLILFVPRFLLPTTFAQPSAGRRGTKKRGRVSFCSSRGSSSPRRLRSLPRDEEIDWSPSGLVPAEP
jgi:hypothetical protein